jgi:hypothetical protein
MASVSDVTMACTSNGLRMTWRTRVSSTVARSLFVNAVATMTTGRCSRMLIRCTSS